MKEINAAASDTLIAMMTESTVNLKSGLTEMNESMESFKIDMRTQKQQFSWR